MRTTLKRGIGRGGPLSGMPSPSLPIVLAMSGASAQPLAQRALDLLLQADQRVEVVIDKVDVLRHQIDLSVVLPAEGPAEADDADGAAR